MSKFLVARRQRYRCVDESALATGAATPEVEDVTPHAGSPNPARDRVVCLSLCNEPEAADFAAASDGIIRRHSAATDDNL